MAVELVEKTVKVPKEMQEIADAITGLIADIKAKKGVAVIAAENLPALVVAVEGYDKVGEEAKTAEGADCIGLLAAGIYKALKA